jgi:type I restriction enzyme, R subunit
MATISKLSASGNTCVPSTECGGGSYPLDFFDFIIIDECHRGGANDEGNWRGII